MPNHGASPVIEDRRSGPPLLDGDRAALEAWLEFYRETLPIKVGGLTPEQLCTRSVAPSTLTLIGIVRHLTKVERFWFANVVCGEDLPRLYCETEPDGDFDNYSEDTALADLERYHAEVAAARQRAATADDLDRPLPGRWREQEINLRWVYLHMIEEYARHLGHADLLRESVDGVTGY
jgi:hypothetical protein